MTEACGGSITIDGEDIATVGLHDLRRRISVIPQVRTVAWIRTVDAYMISWWYGSQDPVLFEGTIRSNLAFASDEDSPREASALWAALDQVGMRDHVESLKDGLDSAVHSGGRNFSVGQRQLLCLARALLRQSRVLVMDEATASVDPTSDALIQKAVREAFVGCTVITVAHRLPTIINYDQVVVMEHGKVVECGSPRSLLDHQGAFSSMVDETGRESAAWLRRSAR